MYRIPTLTLQMILYGNFDNYPTSKIITKCHRVFLLFHVIRTFCTISLFVRDLYM
ncbi:hypothetical protein Hanom_Chr03g00271411 [Helianthus anomalus]